MKKRRWTTQEVHQWLRKNHRYLYRNPQDSNLFVRKRFGFSFALNWGNPWALPLVMAWIIAVLGLVFLLGRLL